MQDDRLPLLSLPYAQVYAWDVAVYVILIVVLHFREVETWIRERDSMADRLRKELQEAQLQRLIVELRPRVLLDALRALVDLVTYNARRAEEILAAVGEFLRATLDSIHERVVPLQMEGQCLGAYARVLNVATTPGLTMQVSIPPSVADELVPNGILRATLDALLGDSPREGAKIRMDVAPDTRGLLVCATCSDHDQRTPRDTAPSRRLEEYEAQGLVELISVAETGVWMRIGASHRGNGNDAGGLAETVDCGPPRRRQVSVRGDTSQQVAEILNISADSLSIR